MHFEGIVHIKASQDLVWEFLTDPEQVSKCSPGVNSLEIVEKNRKFRASVETGLGSVKVKFMMDVEWTALEPPHHAILRAHGAAPGSAVDIDSEMTLIADGINNTTLQWEANVHIVGTIASIATRFAPSVTKTLAAEFFKNVKVEIEK